MPCPVCGHALGSEQSCAYCRRGVEPEPEPERAPRPAGIFGRDVVDEWVRAIGGPGYSTKQAILSISIAVVLGTVFHWLLFSLGFRWWSLSYLLWIGVSYVVFLDAEEHGGVGLFWGVVVYLFNLPGLVVYLMVRWAWVKP